jgi:23S rRNA (guanosine2251-2'-O)-methyltransferase
MLFSEKGIYILYLDPITKQMKAFFSTNVPFFFYFSQLSILTDFMRKLLNSELNRLSPEDFLKAEKIPVTIILDNIRSQHNVGAVFRSSDAFLIESICICGITSHPPNAEIHKSALGSENVVNWKYYNNTLEAVEELKKKGYVIISVEQTVGAVELSEFQVVKDKRYAIIFGNEVKGVAQEIVDLSDNCIEISQFGTKHSLNISVSAGIVIWEFFKKII